MIDLANYELLLSDNYVVLDFETDTRGGHYGVAALPDNGTLLACWKRANSRVWSKWGDELHQEELLDALAECDYFVAHNAKYELGWLRRLGFDIRSKAVVCTQLAEHVLLGNLGPGDKHNQPGLGLSLNDCVTRRGGPAKDPAVDRLIHDGINPVRIPRTWLKQRCAQDVWTTEWLWKSQRAALVEQRKLALCWTRGTLTSPVLADIEWRGMHLDAAKVEETHAAYTVMYNDLLAQMEELTGGINWRSPKQAADFLYGESNDFFEGRVQAWLAGDRSTEYPVRYEGLGFVAPVDKKTGAEDRTTRQSVLDSLTGTSKKQQSFIELRKQTSKVGSALSKALDFYLGVVREKGGTFFAELNQSKAATHRLSSTGIPMKFEMYEDEKSAQFQNQPRVFKPLFVPEQDGWSIGEWDGSQLEFRVAGHLSRDPQILDDIMHGHDVHAFTAAVLFHAPKEWFKNIEEHIDDIKGLMHLVTKEQRQAAKPHTFKPVYGGQSGTPREQAYYAAFRARYKKLAAVQEGWVQQVLANKGTLTTEYGLQYFWPRARMSKSGYCPQSTSIYNYPVQGFATAEIIPIAAAYFWHAIGEAGLDKQIILLNQVHDSVVCAVAPGAEDVFFELARTVWHSVYWYLQQAYGVKDFYVPLGTEIGIGPAWGKPTRSEKWTIWPTGREVKETK